MKTLAQSFIQFYQNFFAVHPTLKKSTQSLKALILAPHPDDECLMSSLALRLHLENNAEVIAVAVTLGSHLERQQERAIEFHNACSTLGAKAIILNPDWEEKLTELKNLLRTEKIDLIVAPHLKDHHPAHIKTSELARTLIKEVQFDGLYLETEFWGELENPNLLIEVTSEVFQRQFDALTKHVGEVMRNPYHLRLASFLVNNVRRGAEKVSSLGSPSPHFAFGSLYLCYQVKKGELLKTPGMILDHSDDLAELFTII